MNQFKYYCQKEHINKLKLIDLFSLQTPFRGPAQYVFLWIAKFISTIRCACTIVPYYRMTCGDDYIWQVFCSENWNDFDRNSSVYSGLNMFILRIHFMTHVLVKALLLLFKVLKCNFMILKWKNIDDIIIFIYHYELNMLLYNTVVDISLTN